MLENRNSLINVLLTESPFGRQPVTPKTNANVFVTVKSFEMFGVRPKTLLIQHYGQGLAVSELTNFREGVYFQSTGPSEQWVYIFRITGCWIKLAFGPNDHQNNDKAP